MRRGGPLRPRRPSVTIRILVALAVLVLASGVASAQVNDVPPADSPAAAAPPADAQQADEEPFDPNALGVDRPSIVDRFAFATLNWVYWALSALIDDADAHTVVFGCRNETGPCQPLPADEWGHYGVVKPSVASGVVVPWQRAMFSLAAGIALLAALLIGLEYMYSGVNLTVRVSLSERLQWLFLGLLLSFLSPWLVEVALSLNLAWTREVGNLAGTLSFDAALGQLYTGENSVGAVGSAFAYAVARLATLLVRVYLYITFLTRSWVVTILWMIAPVLGGSLAMIPRLRPVVGGFWRHTLGEIFMQAVHASILAGLFAIFTRTHNVHPMLVFSVLFGYWAFTRALHGILFGPLAGIAQLAGLGSAASLVGLTMMTAREIGAVRAGLAGTATGWSSTGGSGGRASTSSADVLGATPGAVTASAGAEAHPAVGEHLRPPAQAERVAAWRSIGERVGRAVVGVHAAVAGAAIGMATGDRRLAMAVASAGTAAGERLGASIGATVGGTVSIAPEVVPGSHQSVRRFEAALRSQMPDADPEQIRHTAIGLAGGMPASVAGTRQGIQTAYARRGALIGYALGGGLGQALGQGIGARVGARALRRAAYTPPELPGSDLSAIASEMKPGERLRVQIARDATYVHWQGRDVLIGKGDPRLGPHETAVAEYEIQETKPGVRVPVFRTAYRINPDLSGYAASAKPQGPYIGFGSGSGSGYWMDD